MYLYTVRGVCAGVGECLMYIVTVLVFFAKWILQRKLFPFKSKLYALQA